MVDVEIVRDFVVIEGGEFFNVFEEGIMYSVEYEIMFWELFDKEGYVSKSVLIIIMVFVEL